MFLVLPNYIFTYNGNQYVRVTPYAHIANQPDVYKFSDDSDIGQVAAGTGNPSNYRFFRIEPIKWIVLNYNYLPSQYGTGGDGTHTRLELLANDVLFSGIAPDNILWQDNTINTYLNVTFNQEAFKSENMSIQATSFIYNNISSSDSNLISTGSNTNYLTEGLNSTTQKLYLLSRYEVINVDSPYVRNDIFKSNVDRTETGTDYAKSHNLYMNLENLSTIWWSRTTNGAAIYRINSAGSVSGTNTSAETQMGTRPAMQKQKSRN